MIKHIYYPSRQNVIQTFKDRKTSACDNAYVNDDGYFVNAAGNNDESHHVAVESCQLLEKLNHSDEMLKDDDGDPSDEENDVENDEK